MKYSICYMGFVAIASLPTSIGFVSTGLLSLKPTLTITATNILSPSSTQLGAVAPEVWTNILPPAMGFVKSEWTVSYGYGFASSLSALSLLLRTPITPNNPIFPLQAAALIFYGLRLNLFLFIRNRISSRMQEFQKSIEERAVSRGSRLARVPAVVGCGLLYYALYAPLLLTSMMTGTSVVPPVVLMAMKGLVTLQWCGYLLGAVGDITKSYVKKSQGDERFLVTSGIFSLLRHPNYTGEIIAWTCNHLLGTLAGACRLRNQFSSKILGYLGLSLVGWIGIVYVLLGATGSLEERQKIDYGESDKYKKWVESAWSGWYLPKRTKGSERHEITMDDELEEGSGSGI